MSGFKEIDHGAIKIKHHSTSSLIEIIITTDEEVEQGKFKKINKTVWFDYFTFSDLIKAINKTDF